MLVPMFLLLLEMIIPVMSVLNSVQVISYRGARKTKNGPPLCAIGLPFEITSSSSLKDCSLKCGRDGTFTGFNTKNEVTCEVYKYKPNVAVHVSGCQFYKVYTVSNIVSLCVASFYDMWDIFTHAHSIFG